MSMINNLRKQIDLPVWEWSRFSPVAPTAALSCTCVADNTKINENNGRYIYYLFNATNFWRYDTIADSYMQLASPIVTPITIVSMRFAGAAGYYNRVISATSTTIRTGMPTSRSAIGYKIRIVSGTGAGQERIITNVSEPDVADFGSITQSPNATSITDNSKNWNGAAVFSTGAYSGAYTSTTANWNGWAGYVVRIIPYHLGGAAFQHVRKILYNNNQTLTYADPNIQAYEPFANCGSVSPISAGNYQIESSVVTVDTAWDTTPDQTSRFVIHSGGIYLLSGIAAGSNHAMQYYDILNDAWYTFPVPNNVLTITPMDASLERCTENSTVWHRGQSTAAGTNIVQSNAGWTGNEWQNYEAYVFSGTGRGQIAAITSNSDSQLTVNYSTPLDTTSRFEIIGFDGGKSSSSSNAYNTLIDSSKNWTTNRWTNNAIRILYGKGAGQIRRIASNTATTITVARAWNITPDNTSVYSLQGDSDAMYISWGGLAPIFQYSINSQTTHTGRMVDYGTACIAAALRSDANHNIQDMNPIAITSLSGTTTITALTTQPHCLKVGDWVSIRGVTSAAADQYNVTGNVQVTSVPSTTQFTYTPFVAGTGTYAYLTALSATNLSDASKDFRDNISSATTTSLTFARATPSNINGWYITGTNITPGTRVTSGAGTVTLTIPTQGGTPTGVITFSPWGPTTAITSTYSSGGGAGVATITMTGNTNANINGWYVSGTNIPADTYVTSGAGTATIVLSRACVGAVSGTITFYPPEVAGKLFYITTGAPASASSGGTTTQQTGFGVSPVGGTIGFLGVTLASGPTVAAVSRYTVVHVPTIGANFVGAANNYVYGIATSGSTTTLVDTNSVWSGTTASGAAQATTIFLAATSPGNVSGWYVTGAGVSYGARIIFGAGTNSLLLNTPNSGNVTGTMRCTAFGPENIASVLSPITNKRIRILNGQSFGTEVNNITSATPISGIITFGAVATAPTVNSVYSLISLPIRGSGHELSWAYGNSGILNDDRGRYLWSAKGNGIAGFDKLDLVTDRLANVYTTPLTETLSAGSYFAYDGHNKIYFCKEATQRIYYLDVNTAQIHGAGTVPYTAGTAQIGNKMEIFETSDGADYLFINRHGNQEHFRTLLYY